MVFSKLRFLSSLLLEVTNNDNDALKIREISSSAHTSIVRHLLRPTIYVTHFGEIVPRLSGSVSTMSSFLLIYIIFVSPTKLSTVTYRLMFGLCCCDIIGSTAMSMTHLPMPQDGFLYKIDMYNYQGLRLGNIESCTAQGFFVFFGIIATCGYNSMLCVYYACIIALNISEEKILKYIEPILHLFPIVTAFSVAVLPLFHELYNVNPWEPWCSVTPVPYGCHSGCQRGRIVHGETDVIQILSLIALQFLLIFVSLGMVCTKVIKVQRHMHFLHRRSQLSSNNRQARLTNNHHNDEISNMDVHVNVNDQQRSNQATLEAEQEERVRTLQDRHRITKVVLAQSASYIAAQVLTLIWFVLNKVFFLDFAHMRCIFQPLQGFWNFLIFICFKVYHLRKSDDSLTFMGALVVIFFPLRRGAPGFDPGENDDGEGGVDNNNRESRIQGEEDTNPGHISIVRTQNDDLEGFQVGEEFISVDEYMEFHENMDGLSVNSEGSGGASDEDPSSRKRTESEAWSEDNVRSQRSILQADLEDAFSFDEENEHTRS